MSLTDQAHHSSLFYKHLIASRYRFRKVLAAIICIEHRLPDVLGTIMPLCIECSPIVILFIYINKSMARANQFSSRLSVEIPITSFRLFLGVHLHPSFYVTYDLALERLSSSEVISLVKCSAGCNIILNRSDFRCIMVENSLSADSRVPLTAPPVHILINASLKKNEHIKAYLVYG